MRCRDCNKFVGLECADPEVDDLAITPTGEISGSVRCVRNCADCGSELKEANFDIDSSLEVPEPKKGHEHELDIVEDSVESTESGGSRYQKNMVGYELRYTVSCSGCGFNATGTVEDSLQASAWDELV